MYGDYGQFFPKFCQIDLLFLCRSFVEECNRSDSAKVIKVDNGFDTNDV